jgi:hypothetical protein
MSSLSVVWSRFFSLRTNLLGGLLVLISHQGDVRRSRTAASDGGVGLCRKIHIPDVLPIMDQEDTLLQDEVSRVNSPPQLHIEVEATPEAHADIEHAGDDGSTTKKRGKKEGPVLREREPGKSVLPFSRVQRIIKADKACLCHHNLFATQTSNWETWYYLPSGPSDSCQRRDIFDIARDRRIHQEALGGVS